MTAYWEGYRGLDVEDMERLNALASSHHRPLMRFAEAFDLLGRVSLIG